MAPADVLLLSCSVWFFRCVFHSHYIMNCCYCCAFTLPRSHKVPCARTCSLTFCGCVSGARIRKKMRHDSNIYSYTIQHFCRLAFKHFFSALFLFSRAFEQIKRERESVCMCSVWWMILAFGRSLLCWRCTTEIRLKEAKIYLLTTSKHTHTHKHSLVQKVRLMTESWKAERVRVVQVLHTV